MNTNNRFLQSSLTENNLATETTLKRVETELSGGVSINGPVTINQPVNVKTDTNDRVAVSINSSDITGTLPVSVTAVTITDYDFTSPGPQTSDVNVSVKNTSLNTNASQTGTWDVGQTGTWNVNANSSQTGTWDVGQTGTWDVGQTGTWNVNSTQTGTWDVGQTGTWNVNANSSQTGTWDVGQTGTWNVNSNASQTGTWDVGQTGTWDVGQTGVWNVGLTDLVAVDDVVDDTSRGPLLYARQYEQKADDLAKNLWCNDDGQLLTYNNNPSVELTEPVRVWHNMISDVFAPFTDKYIDVQGASTADINGFYTSTTPTNDFNVVYIEDKFRLCPFHALEFTISGNFEYDNTTNDAHDYQRIGLMSNIPTGLGVLPNTAIWFKADANNVNQWFGQIINNGAMQVQNPLNLSHNPGDDLYFCFRIRVINNGGLITAQWFDYTQSTQVFRNVQELSLNVPLENNEFYLCNYFGASSGLTTTSKIVSYQIRSDHPDMNPYPCFNQYLSFFHQTTQALTSGAIRALTAVRLNPANTTQSTVYLHEVDTMATSGGGSWVLGIYRNPTLSGALTWNNYGRIQYSTQQATITVTAGTPSFIEYGVRWSGGGLGTNHYKVPIGSVALYEPSDMIVFGIFSFANDSYVSGFTVVY